MEFDIRKVNNLSFGKKNYYLMASSTLVNTFANRLMFDNFEFSYMLEQAIKAQMYMVPFDFERCF